MVNGFFYVGLSAGTRVELPCGVDASLLSPTLEQGQARLQTTAKEGLRSVFRFRYNAPPAENDNEIKWLC